MEANGDLQPPPAGRHRRPESSASSRSRYTQQSSNGSSSNQQHRGQTISRGTEKVRDQGQMERRGTSGASFLQERLKEKKAARLGDRRRSADSSNMPFDSSGVNSSPKLGASSGPGRDRDGRPGSSGDRNMAKKGMGVKEMEAAASTLHKENWALKLTVQFHQQRQSDLEERLEAAELRVTELEDEGTEMQSINEQLLAELETRDQALEESLGIICDLEEQIEQLKGGQNINMSNDNRSESASPTGNHSATGYRGPGSARSLSQRDDEGYTTLGGSVRRKGTPRHMARMPSFLSDNSEGAEALRSLYLPTDQEGQGKSALPKLSEENGTDSEHTEGMDSPRLSVLSESSFLSVYGEKGLGLNALNLDVGQLAGSPDYRRHRKSISIEKWVDERARATSSAPKRPSAPKTTNLRIGQFNSINDIIESPLQRLEKLAQRSKHPSLLFHNDPSAARDRGGHGQSKPRDNLRRTEMTAFEYEHGLPPTPDTISTSTLRMHEKLGENPAPESGEPDPGRGPTGVASRTVNSSFTNLLGARPHSAGETITSRREGHGWDTVTQSEVTSVDGEASAPSTFDPWMAVGREKRRPTIQPPDLFNFGCEEDDEWAGDDTSNLDAGSYLPPLKPYDRNPPRARNPRSEDTIVGPSRLRRSHSTDSSPRYPPRGPLLSHHVSPNPPERSSSLAAASPSEKRTRRARNAEPILSLSSVQPGLRAAAALPTNQAQANSKRSRVGRLFSLGRSEQQSNAPPPPLPPPVVAQHKLSTRSQSFTNPARRRRNSVDLNHVGKEMHRASGATPPPISRYPRPKEGTGSVGAQIVRPLSSTSLESNLRDRSTRQRGYDDGFGVDGAGDDTSDLRIDALANAIASGNAKRGSKDFKVPGRKWFGLGRTGSQMR